MTLPSPDFTWNPETNPPKAGLRPKRSGTYRLEPEQQGNRLIVHNYGHAGAGITMSWGCAQEILDVILSAGFAQGEPIAVLGGGVMGLTAAVLLTEHNFKVAIYAKSYPPDTTSNVAGGQWAPASVEHNNATKAQFERILIRSFHMHQARGPAYGVTARANYSETPLPSFANVPSSIVPAPETLRHLPFSRLTRPGLKYSTLLVEPPIFLPKLLQDLDHAQVQRHTRVFDTLNQVLSDPSITQKVIVNCTGLGARQICNDPRVYPVKGQLVMLPAQPQLQYLFCSPGYLFPRQDAVVVGGSEEKHFADDKPDLSRCRLILANVRRAFEPTLMDKLTPRVLAARLAPDWLIQSK